MDNTKSYIKLLETESFSPPILKNVENIMSSVQLDQNSGRILNFDNSFGSKKDDSKKQDEYSTKRYELKKSSSQSYIKMNPFLTKNSRQTDNKKVHRDKNRKNSEGGEFPPIQQSKNFPNLCNISKKSKFADMKNSKNSVKKYDDVYKRNSNQFDREKFMREYKKSNKKSISIIRGKEEEILPKI